jgi:hypothetical protein
VLVQCCKVVLHSDGSAAAAPKRCKVELLDAAVAQPAQGRAGCCHSTSCLVCHQLRQQHLSPDIIIQLNDDVWAQVLLPKLIADQAAGAVAASCSSLRKLCHGTVRKLNLKAFGSTCSNAITVQHHLAALHQHFPDCSTVKMALGTDSSYLLAPAIVEGLSRQVATAALPSCDACTTLTCPCLTGDFVMAIGCVQ